MSIYDIFEDFLRLRNGKRLPVGAAFRINMVQPQRAYSPPQ
jgi:hypothetical protein